MDAQSISSIASALLAGSVALVIPWQTFQFTLRQERVRLMTEQRTALYTDMLVEAHAEQQWLAWWISGAEATESVPFEDMRLSVIERARLGARGTALGSKLVNRRFNELMSVMSRIHFEHAIGQLPKDAAQMQLRVMAGRAAELLEAAIREELDADAALRRSRWPRP